MYAFFAIKKQMQVNKHIYLSPYNVIMIGSSTK